MDTSIKWFIVIIVIVGTIIYLNQEVPMCIDNPIQKSAPVLNYSNSTVDKVNTQLQSDIIIFETNGSSMEPLIHNNQRCACVRSQTYSVGDIVVFFGNFGEGFQGIAHPIINISEDGLITTHGINNNFSDYPIHKNNILCKIPLTKKINLLGI